MVVVDPDIEAALASVELGLAVLRGADFALLGNLDRLDVLERLEHVGRTVPGIGHELVAELEAQRAVADVPYGGMTPLLAETLHIRFGTAQTMISRARMLGPRTGVSGAVVEPVLPLVAPAQRAGLINADHVRVIVKFFRDVPSRVPAAERQQAEEQLVELAKTMRPDELEAVAARILAHLNPDGSLDDERERRKDVGIWMEPQDEDGLSRGTFCVGARLRAFLEIVFAKFAKPGMCNPEDADSVLIPDPLDPPPELPPDPLPGPDVVDVPVRRRRRRRCPMCGGEVGEDGKSATPAGDTDAEGDGGADRDADAAVGTEIVLRGSCPGHPHGHSDGEQHGYGSGPDNGADPRPARRKPADEPAAEPDEPEPEQPSPESDLYPAWPKALPVSSPPPDPDPPPDPELDLGLPPAGGAQGFDATVLAAAARLDQRPWWLRNADALEHVLGSALADPRLGQHRGLPVTAVVTMTVKDLEAATGKALSGGGSIIPIRDAIRMAAHAHPYLVVFDDDGRPLYLGRGRRLASADQRLVLYARDRGCTFPGCPRPGYHCQSHHIDEWAADHGHSDVDKLTFACEQHHPLVGTGPQDWATTTAPPGGPYGLRTLWHPPAFMDPLRRGRVNHFHHPDEYLREAPEFPGPDGEPPPQRE